MGLFSFGRKSNNDPRITVRLQVWHYHARGRCPDFNRELASFFTPKDLLKNWTVHPAKVVEPPDISSRDEYVPVEVGALRSPGITIPITDGAFFTG